MTFKAPIRALRALSLAAVILGAATAAVPPDDKPFSWNGISATLPFHWTTETSEESGVRLSCSDPSQFWIEFHDGAPNGPLRGISIIENIGWTKGQDPVGGVCKVEPGRSATEVITGLFGFSSEAYRFADGPLLGAVSNLLAELQDVLPELPDAELELGAAAFVVPWVQDGQARDTTFIAVYVRSRYNLAPEISGFDYDLYQTVFLVALTTPAGVAPLDDPEIRAVLESLEQSEAWLREMRQAGERYQMMVRPPEHERPAPISWITLVRDSLLAEWDGKTVRDAEEL